VLECYKPVTASAPLPLEPRTPGPSFAQICPSHPPPSPPSKPCYLPDLLAAEALGLVGHGTVVAADNVVYPGEDATALNTACVRQGP
jgi:hypothetical protein